MIPHDELHVDFGTGPVGLAVMRELHGSRELTLYWYPRPIAAGVQQTVALNTDD